MSNKIYSEERTGRLGNKYTVHKDQNGNNIGTSEQRESFLGGKYTQLWMVYIRCHIYPVHGFSVVQIFKAYEWS